MSIPKSYVSLVMAEVVFEQRGLDLIIQTDPHIAGSWNLSLPQACLDLALKVDLCL